MTKKEKWVYINNIGGSVIFYGLIATWFGSYLVYFLADRYFDYHIPASLCFLTALIFGILMGVEVGKYHARKALKKSGH